MAIQKRFPVQNNDVFPAGCYAVSDVEAVRDYDLPADAEGQRPQKLDKDTGLPMWQVSVLDADPEAGKKQKTASVKLASAQVPLVPENKSGFPFTPVEFVGLTALPYVDEGGGRPQVAWSFRAESMTAPGAPASAPAAASSSGKASAGGSDS